LPRSKTGKPASSARPVEGIASEMRRMMMLVELGCPRIGMTEPAGDLPEIDALLREPSAAGMPQGMGRYVVETGPLAGAREGMLDPRDRFAVPIENRRRRRARARLFEKPPQTPRNWLLGAALLGPRPAGRIEVDQAAVEIDLREPYRSSS
jgi:hypothetical protein